MIILDLQQVMLASILVNPKETMRGGRVERDIVRHMILNSIRFNRFKFKDYGELVIACDSRNSWRRELFPFYKANRKKNRQESLHDWEDIFEFLSTIRADLLEHFPYRVVQVDGAEADDIIATLINDHYSDDGMASMERFMILSGDKDFKQLHYDDGVKQWDPPGKRWLSSPSPHMFLREHIIRGDKSDGIPNIFSHDNSYATGARQKPIRADKMEQLLKYPAGSDELRKALGETTYRNWCRNNQLINLALIPEEVKIKIRAAYEAEAGKTRKKIYPYLVRSKLIKLSEALNEF